MKRIDEVYIFCAEDGDGEGLVAANLGEVFMPLVAADRDRLKDIFPLAQKIAFQEKKRITLRKLSQAEDIVADIREVEEWK